MKQVDIATAYIALAIDIEILRDKFEDRYQALWSLKKKGHQAKAARRSLLDLNKLCREHGIAKYKKEDK